MFSKITVQRQCQNCIRILQRNMSTKYSDVHKGKPDHIDLTAHHTREPDILDAKIMEIKNLSTSVKGYTLSVPKSSTFKAGQWVDFFIPGVEMIGGFSMCSPPSELENENELTLAVKYSEWPPANWLHTSAKEEDWVSLRFGGDFHYPDKDTDLVKDHSVFLIAGGVGINPLASIYLHIFDLMNNGHSECTKAHMLFSARTSDELLFKSKFDEIAKKKSDVFSVDYMRTRENNDERVTKKKLSSTLDEKFSSKEKVFCYLCGPPQMVKDLTNDLESLGIPKCNIKYELWW